MLGAVVLLAACGDGLGVSAPAAGFWYFDFSAASGDSTCAMRDGLLVFDDSAGTFRAYLDGYLDCDVPNTYADGSRFLADNPEGQLANGTISMVAPFGNVVIATFTGEYTGGAMRGEVSAEIPNSPNPTVTLAGRWSAERDRDADRALDRLQGEWRATQWMLGSTDLLANADVSWTLTFDGRRNTMVIAGSDFQEGGYGWCLIRDDILRIRTVWTGILQYAFRFSGNDRLILEGGMQGGTYQRGTITFERQP